jgi:hypothetical protein
MRAWCEVLGGFWMGSGIGVNSKPLNTWSHPPGSNRRPADYESAALPTELGWPKTSGAEHRPSFDFSRWPFAGCWSR